VVLFCPVFWPDSRPASRLPTFVVATGVNTLAVVLHCTLPPWYWSETRLRLTQTQYSESPESGQRKSLHSFLRKVWGTRGNNAINDTTLWITQIVALNRDIMFLSIPFWKQTPNNESPKETLKAGLIRPQTAFSFKSRKCTTSTLKVYTWKTLNVNHVRGVSRSGICGMLGMRVRTRRSQHTRQLAIGAQPCRSDFLSRNWTVFVEWEDICTLLWCTFGLISDYPLNHC